MTPIQSSGRGGGSGRLAGVISILSARPAMTRAVVYTALFIAAILVFVYVRFPQQALDGIVGQATKTLPVKMTPETSRLTFPPGVDMTNVEVSGRGIHSRGRLLTLDSLEVRPSLMSIFTGERTTFLNARLLEGFAEAMVTGDNPAKKMDVVLSFSGLQPERGLWWPSGGPPLVSGKIGGKAEFTALDNSVVKSSGEFHAELIDGVIVPPKEVMIKLPPLNVDRGELSLELKNGVLHIEKTEFKGPGLSAAVTGTVIVNPVLRMSRLDVTASVKFSGDLGERLKLVTLLFPKEPDGSINIRIGGTVEKPALK